MDRGGVSFSESENHLYRVALPIDIVLVALIKCALSKLSAGPNRIYLHRMQDQGNLLDAGNRRK